jgi:hypothetical protein
MDAMWVAVLLAIGGALGVGGALFWMDYRRQREAFERAVRAERHGNNYVQSLLLSDVNQLKKEVKALGERVDRLDSSK